MNAGQELMNGSTASITRLDELAERVQAEDLNPLNSSPTPSDKDNKESSIEQLSLSASPLMFYVWQLDSDENDVGIKYHETTIRR